MSSSEEVMPHKAQQRFTQEILSAGHDLARCLRVLPGGLFAEFDGGLLHPVTVSNGHPPVAHDGQGCFSGFCFHITHSKTGAGQTAAGTFTFSGSPHEAERALLAAGFRRRRGAHAGKREFRTRGSWLTGANSAHFLLIEGPVNLSGENTAQGEFHFGEHNPYSPLGWLLHWFFEALR
ncbi:hypothetical protein FTW19_20370 [Terriglobus albidus]|uniref:Uncharacterized protein n=1 Tax=Terriglobus albidus TaxID=1592106 RepID=A0A5B9EED6_9BACT|nr:hypothetical protein [Terriglobus albidus]QEE30129.1 hypothetical protein FTW19_20370 [Terriglobus albidus]